MAVRWLDAQYIFASPGIFQSTNTAVHFPSQPKALVYQREMQAAQGNIGHATALCQTTCHGNEHTLWYLRLRRIPIIISIEWQFWVTRHSRGRMVHEFHLQV